MDTAADPQSSDPRGQGALWPIYQEWIQAQRRALLQAVAPAVGAALAEQIAAGGGPRITLEWQGDGWLVGIAPEASTS